MCTSSPLPAVVDDGSPDFPSGESLLCTWDGEGEGSGSGEVSSRGLLTP